jgi:hypothetical protein
MGIFKRLFARADDEARLRAQLNEKMKVGEASYDLASEQTRRLEAALRQKKAQYDASDSPGQRAILVGQINVLAKELEMLIARSAMTDRFMIDLVDAAHRAETVISAKRHNLDGASVDRLAVQLEEAIEKLQDTDAAMKQLQAQSYISASRTDPLPLRPASQPREIAAPSVAEQLPPHTRLRLKALGIEDGGDS